MLLFGIDRLRGLLLYVNYLGARVSMGVEKIFCGGSSGFLFVAEALFWFLYGVFGRVWWWLIVTFNVAERHFQCW